MVIAVPLFGVIYDIVRKLTARGLERNQREDILQEYNEEFHEKMLDAIMETLSPEELVVWAKSCDRLTQFLKSYDTSHIKTAK